MGEEEEEEKAGDISLLEWEVKSRQGIWDRGIILERVGPNS